MSIILYGITTWSIKKNAKRKYRRMLCCLEEILEVTPYKTVSVRLHASHLTNHSSKMNTTCWVLPKKLEGTHQHFIFLKTSSRTSQCWATSKDLQMDHSDGCLDRQTDRQREGVRCLRAVRVTWWWWDIYKCFLIFSFESFSHQR